MLTAITKTKQEQTTISVRLPVDLEQQFKQVAAKYGLSISEAIRQLITDTIKQEVK